MMSETSISLPSQGAPVGESAISKTTGALAPGQLSQDSSTLLLIRVRIITTRGHAINPLSRSA